MPKQKYVVTLERGVVFEVEVEATDSNEAKRLGWEKAEGMELRNIPWASMEERDNDKVVDVEEKK